MFPRNKINFGTYCKKELFWLLMKFSENKFLTLVNPSDDPIISLCTQSPSKQYIQLIQFVRRVLLSKRSINRRET